MSTTTKVDIAAIVAEERERVRTRYPHTPAADLPVRLNGRLRRALGRAHFTNGEATHIEIASAIAWTEEALRDVVRHEFAHCIAGRDAGHGYAWKLVARALGANPEAVCKFNLDTGRKTFTLACKACKATVGTLERHRRPTQLVRNRVHRGCGGRLEILD